MSNVEKDQNTATDPAQVEQVRPKVFPLEESLPLFIKFDDAANKEAARPAPTSFEQSAKRLAALIDQLPQRAVIEDKHATRWLEHTMKTAVMRMELEAESSDFTAEEKAAVSEILEELGGDWSGRPQAERKVLEDRLEQIADESRRAKSEKTGSEAAGVDPAMVAAAHNHVLWHIRRASGIGGSEAGTVMKHFKGKRGTFGDAHNLVLEKLLIMSPRPSTDEMARGVRAEPWVQKMYHEKHGVVSAQADLDKLRGFRWARRPASVGTPDDIVVHTLGEFAGKKRCLDYKAPSAAVVAEYKAKGVSEDYVCQLHHYATLQLASRSTFDVMSIEAFDPATFKIVSFEVTFDVKLANEIANSCHRLWHEFVMMGVVPDAPKPDDLAVEDPALLQIAARLAMLKKLGDEINKQAAELQERISLVGSDWHAQATGKLDLGVAAFNRKRKWDEEALKQLAEAADIPLDPFMDADKKGKLDADIAAEYLKDIFAAAADEAADVDEVLEKILALGLPVQRKLDPERLAAYLEEHGIDTLAAAGVQESFLMSRKTKGPEFERMTQVNAWASELAVGIADMCITEAPRIILGEEREMEDEGFDPDAAMA